MAPRLKFLSGFLALPALAAACALAANVLAGPSRHLAWRGWTPPADAPRATPLPPEPQPLAPEDSGLKAPTLAPKAPDVVPPLPAKPPAPAPRPARPEAPDRFAPDPSAVIREIGEPDAAAAFGRRIPFLDARRTAEYREGHVPGAVSLPVWEADLEARITQWEASAARAPKDPIVIYCGGGCEDSRLLAGKLVALGYRNLLLYPGGFPAWQEASRPVAKGDRP